MRQLALIFSLVFSVQVFGLSNEVALGILRQSTAERLSSGQRTSPRPGYGLGFKTESYSYENFYLKIGLMYEQRTVTDLFSGIEHNFDLKTLDLMTHLAYRSLFVHQNYF